MMLVWNGLGHNMGHSSWVNGVRLVLLALSATACANAETNDNANNASLTPPQVAHVVTKAFGIKGLFFCIQYLYIQIWGN